MASNYAPTYKVARRKVKLHTKKQMSAHKAARAAERAAERKADKALLMVPRKWQKQEREMEAMLRDVAD